MAYTLKLNIYQFRLFRIIGKEEHRRGNGTITHYYASETPSSFSEVAKTIDPQVTREDYMQTIFSSILAFFDNKFKVSTDGSKAISITNGAHPIFGSESYTISGFFKGGETGIDRKVYQQDNATESEKTIERNDVPANNFFYKLWIPFDSEDGILMIQSYTDEGCTATFKDQIEQFFFTLEFRAKWSRMIPRGMVTRYLQRSVINQIRVVHARQRREGGGVFGSLQQATKVSVIKDFSIRMQDLFASNNYEDELKAQIESVVPFDEENDLVKVFYRDENGKKAHAKISDLEKAMPSIILPDSLKDPNTFEPILGEIDHFTDGILNEIKEQIDYRPKIIE